MRDKVYILYLAYRDPRTPWATRLLAMLIVAYALSPLDLIPDFIPILGYLDDFILVPLGITLALRLIPPAVMADCRERASAVAKRPIEAWVVSGAIVVLWVAIAFILLYAVLTVMKGE